MAELLDKTGEVKEAGSSANSTPPSKRPFKLLLALVALAAVVALLVLGVYLFFVDTAPHSVSPGPGTPPRSPVGAAEELNPRPDPADFGYQAEPGPTPSPLPAGNEPARLRALADEYLAQGRPVEAAAEYRLVLDKYASSPEARPALYGLARASYGRGRYTEAADSFKKYLGAYSNDPLRANCFYYLGLTATQLGFWDESVLYFQRYQSERPGAMPLDGYAWFEIGEAYTNSLKLSQAMEAYKKVASSQATNLLRVTAMEKLGDYYVKENNPAEGAVWYAKILEIARVPDYRAGVVAKQARAYDAAKQSDRATALTRQLLSDYLETSTGFSTLRTLFNANSPLLDDYLRGYFSLQAEDWTGALASFDRFLGRPDDKAAQPPTPPGLTPEAQNRLARAWFYLATVYAGKGDLDRAGAEYRDLLARFPQSPAAPDVLAKLAGQAEKAAKPDDAMTLWSQLVERYPTNPQAEDAAFNQFRLALAKGPEAALPYAEALARRFPGSDRRAEAFYNLGKAFQAKSDTPNARAALQKASEAPLTDFYAVRATERLRDAYDPNKPPRSTPTTHPTVYDPKAFAADFERDRAALEKWLVGWAIPTGTSTSTAATASPTITTTPDPAKQLEAARTRLRDDPAFKRLVALRELGQDNEADRESRELYDRLNDKPLDLYVLSLALSEHSEYYYSVTAAQRLLNLYQLKNPQAGLRQLPLLLQKLIYPLPFQTMVLEQTRRQDFDPLLLVALMKQESAFDPEATSSVGARGLSQVMPDTGKGIAANLDKPGFKPDDLYRPYTAIEFGAYYLAARLKDFEGNPYEALSAYNGGAGNVYRWSKAASPSQNFDKWVDNIDYPETRKYVRIIYASYYMYRQIYGS